MLYSIGANDFTVGCKDSESKSRLTENLREEVWNILSTIRRALIFFSLTLNVYVEAHLSRFIMLQSKISQPE